MRREICGKCGAPISDDGTCDCAELLKRGWRQCAKGQKVTQWCAEAERVRGELREQIERDEALLRQALEALIEQRCALYQTGSAREAAIAALRDCVSHGCGLHTAALRLHVSFF